MDIYPGASSRARITRAAREQRFRGDATMRVDFVVPRVEDDAGADHLVGEGDRARIDNPGREVAAEHAPPREGPEVGMVDCSAGQDPQRSHHPALHADARKQSGAADLVEVRPGGRDAVPRVLCVVPQAVIAQSIHAYGAEGESGPPAGPPRRCLCVRDEREAALGTGPDIEVDRREVRLRALGGAHGAVPAIVEPDPQPVARAVGQIGIEVAAPVALRRQRRRGHREQRERGASGSQRAARRGGPCRGVWPRCRRARRTAPGRARRRRSPRACSLHRT